MLNEGLTADSAMVYVVLAAVTVFMVINGVRFLKRFNNKKHKGKRH